MGLKFVDNKAGDKMYFCASCYIYLADKSACISTSFTGTTGQAYLFRGVVNVRFGALLNRGMLTGAHYIRDAFCINCKQVLGWMYELAPNETERYKEGKVILERIRILETEGITNDSQLDRRTTVRRTHYRSHADYYQNLEEVYRNRDRRQTNETARQRVMQVVDRINNRNDVFRAQEDGTMPTIALYDEERIAQAFGYNEDQIANTRDNVVRLNEAIAQCIRGNTADLWLTGFRADVARQFREMREVMEGRPYRASRSADHSLIQLLESMRRERERTSFLNSLNSGGASDEFPSSEPTAPPPSDPMQQMMDAVRRQRDEDRARLLREMARVVPNADDYDDDDVAIQYLLERRNMRRASTQDSMSGLLALNPDASPQ